MPRPRSPLDISPTAAKKAASLQRREAALALRETMSPTGPAEDRFRLATWNVNSVRSRLGGIERFLERARPDVLCLQETKTGALTAEAATTFDRLGYEVSIVGAGQYNGVAVLSRHPIDGVTATGDFGDEHLDREPRLLSCLVHPPHGEPMRVATVYVPHGRELGHWHYDYKLEFLHALAKQVGVWLEQGQLLVCGDVNVAPTNSDIFHPDAFVGLTHVSEPERSAFAELVDAGLVDVDVARWGPDARRFTWWNYGFNYSRNLGMRIDVILASPGLASKLDTTWIDHVERAVPKPSDHAALIADFDLGA
jgi:exodeoxyribonuclease-3